jgi:hypothetical protein
MSSVNVEFCNNYDLSKNTDPVKIKECINFCKNNHESCNKFFNNYCINNPTDALYCNFNNIGNFCTKYPKNSYCNVSNIYKYCSILDNSNNYNKHFCIDYYNNNLGSYNEYLVSYCDSNNNSPLCLNILNNPNNNNDMIIHKSKIYSQYLDSKNTNDFIKLDTIGSKFVYNSPSNERYFINDINNYCNQSSINMETSECKNFYNNFLIPYLQYGLFDIDNKTPITFLSNNEINIDVNNLLDNIILISGQGIRSTNGNIALILTSNGYLTSYNLVSQTQLWKSLNNNISLSNNPPYKLIIKQNSIVIIDNSNNIISTLINTSNNIQKLVINNDGGINIFDILNVSYLLYPNPNSYETFIEKLDPNINKTSCLNNKKLTLNCLNSTNITDQSKNVLNKYINYSKDLCSNPINVLLDKKCKVFLSDPYFEDFSKSIKYTIFFYFLLFVIILGIISTIIYKKLLKKNNIKI